jgi:cytochrome c peroxidase
MFSRTKGPILRGLAARAPHFHNGAARNLSELLDFYNHRFQMNLTDEEKRAANFISQFALVWSAVASQRWAVSKTGV